LKPTFNNIFIIYFLEIDDFLQILELSSGLKTTSIDFFFNGDVRLGYGLLKYAIFKEKGQSVRQ